MYIRNLSVRAVLLSGTPDETQRSSVGMYIYMYNSISHDSVTTFLLTQLKYQFHMIPDVRVVLLSSTPDPT